jgi:hypothetical protein
MFASLLYGFNSSGQVTVVIEGIKNSKNINTVVSRAFYKGAHNIIGIVPVTQQVLASQQHLQACVGQCLAQLLQTFPGVLLQKSQAGIKGGAAPDLQ